MYIPKKRFWLVIVSVFLILISSILSDMTFSRYELQQNGRLEASIGDMLYSISNLKTSNNNEIVYTLDNMKPEDVCTYSFTVMNYQTPNTTPYSKIPFNYTISIETYGTLPLTIKLENSGLPSGSGVACPTKTATYPTTSLTSTGKMYVDAYYTHTYKVTVTWPSANNASSYSDEIECLIVKTSVGQLQPAYS